MYQINIDILELIFYYLETTFLKAFHSFSFHYYLSRKLYPHPTTWAVYDLKFAINLEARLNESLLSWTLAEREWNLEKYLCFDLVGDSKEIRKWYTLLREIFLPYNVFHPFFKYYFTKPSRWLKIFEHGGRSKDKKRSKLNANNAISINTVSNISILEDIYFWEKEKKKNFVQKISTRMI